MKQWKDQIKENTQYVDLEEIHFFYNVAAHAGGEQKNHIRQIAQDAHEFSKTQIVKWGEKHGLGLNIDLICKHKKLHPCFKINPTTEQIVSVDIDEIEQWKASVEAGYTIVYPYTLNDLIFIKAHATGEHKEQICKVADDLYNFGKKYLRT